RKAGGILIENLFQGSDWKYSVVGIGLNINQIEFPGIKATSLALVTGQQFDILQLAKQLTGEVERAYNQLLSHPDSIREEYLKNLYGKDQQVRLKKGNRTFEVKILGVSDQGHLLTRHAFEEGFKVGEVEWIY
ncbi:MAG TPA: biotin--[acetyl-CoA-carboxylase] ligase, partial [Chitinophagaceae bacterium]